MPSLITTGDIPTVGHVFGPERIDLTSASVRDYVNSTGDEAFAAHQLRMGTVFGNLICPSTILDRSVGTRLAAMRYQNDYALHAKQSFTFHKPLLEGSSYVIEGVLSNIYDRNDIKYFTITTKVSDEDDSIVLESDYTRAFQFPGARHPQRSTEPLTLRRFLDEALVDRSDSFSVGTTLQGSTRRLSQDLMNLYSGPTSNIHTDVRAAAVRGHSEPIVQGLMALSLESELFRDVFGERWYTTGRVSTRFIRPIRAGSVLTPWAVVTAREPDQIVMRSGVFNQDGIAVTISEARVSQ